MRISVAAIPSVLSATAVLVASLATLCLPLRAAATVTIKDRTVNEPLVLDQNEDYFLSKVYISGINDLAALTLTGKIHSVTLSQCVFSNIWAGMNGKAVATEATGAIVDSFVATDTAFEDAQHQLLCLREGAFGTVTLQRCKFRTSDTFLKKIYASDPWRTTPPTTEFANIERLELLDNEYVNTILVIHSSVKVVIFRGDVTNVRLQSPSTHVIRLEKGQDPTLIPFGATALTAAPAAVDTAPVIALVEPATVATPPDAVVPCKANEEAMPVENADESFVQFVVPIVGSDRNAQTSEKPCR